MSAAAPPPESFSRRDAAGLVLLTLGVALIVVDMSIVNLVLPQMATDLDMGFAALQYVSVLFSLAGAAVVIAAGDVADRIGARRAYLGGLVVFLVGSVMAAAAPTGGVLLAARVVQGLAGGVVMTSALATINASWSGPARGMAFALYGATFAAACAVGPLLGAVVAEAADWRFAFWINLVLGPIAYAGVVRFVPAVAPQSDARRPDIAGTVLVSGALTALTFAVVQAGTYGWIDAKRDIELLGVAFTQGGVSPTPVALGIAGALFAAFVAVQRVRVRRDRPVILDPEVTKVRSFTLGSVALLIVGMGEFGLIFLLPLELQAGHGLTPIEAGLIMLATPVAAIAAFPLVQALAQRSATRTAVLAGLLLEAVGLAGIAVAISSPHVLWLIPGLFVYGLGIGAATAQLSMLVLSDVPAARSSLASGISTAVRQLGSSLGVALLGLLFSGVVGRTSGALAEQPVQTMAEHRAAGDPSVIAGAADVLADGVAVAGLAAAAILVIGAIAVRALPRGEAHGAWETDDAVEPAYA
jgi:EmrB/QacA subfamily drug resistance transporter